MDARIRSQTSKNQCWKEQTSFENCLKLKLFDYRCVIDNHLYKKCLDEKRLIGNIHKDRKSIP